MSEGRKDDAFDLSQGYGRVASSAEPAEGHGVAVLEERSRLAALQLDRLPASPGELDEAAAAAGVRARDRPGPKEVAGADRGAVVDVLMIKGLPEPVDGDVAWI
jgi:hypothetical protein